MSSLQSLRKKALANPAVKVQYDALESEFINVPPSKHEPSGLTQQEMVECMGKPPSKH
ncbi:hypothetical protein RJD38_21740 (plasmid) [Vibrio scophthalmi]|uniref:hypothetical protein n=1 Tax=Vibrio scophthalmi TaxID=45658 RepID=UPI0008091B12|nr:hypothetical protein [Vibrio scophthalmi]ANS88101.1 hypothetical protein VSVS12_04402 [Vibrio scophthalmi]